MLPDVRRAREALVSEQPVLRITSEVDRKRRAAPLRVQPSDRKWLLPDTKCRVMHHHVLLGARQLRAELSQRHDQRPHLGIVIYDHHRPPQEYGSSCEAR
jgi:hypothetical protein